MNESFLYVMVHATNDVADLRPLSYTLNGSNLIASHVSLAASASVILTVNETAVVYFLQLYLQLSVHYRRLEVLLGQPVSSARSFFDCRHDHYIASPFKIIDASNFSSATSCAFVTLFSRPG
jgi:hypothetical protein